MVWGNQPSSPQGGAGPQWAVTKLTLANSAPTKKNHWTIWSSDKTDLGAVFTLKICHDVIGAALRRPCRGALACAWSAYLIRIDRSQTAAALGHSRALPLTLGWGILLSLSLSLQAKGVSWANPLAWKRLFFNAPACTPAKTSRCGLLHSCQPSHRALKGTKDPNCPSGGRTLLEGEGAKVTWAPGWTL